jgi:hypothetical protein
MRSGIKIQETRIRIDKTFSTDNRIARSALRPFAALVACKPGLCPGPLVSVQFSGRLSSHLTKSVFELI